MKLLEANGRLAIHLTVDEINSIIKTHLLNQGYASESEVEYAMVIRPHELDADLTGAYIPVDPQEWTAENCPLIREQTEADECPIANEDWEGGLCAENRRKEK